MNKYEARKLKKFKIREKRNSGLNFDWKFTNYFNTEMFMIPIIFLGNLFKNDNKRF